jgi:hypothetical protein
MKNLPLSTALTDIVRDVLVLEKLRLDTERKAAVSTNTLTEWQLWNRSALAAYSTAVEYEESGYFCLLFSDISALGVEATHLGDEDTAAYAFSILEYGATNQTYSDFLYAALKVAEYSFDLPTNHK